MTRTSLWKPVKVRYVFLIQVNSNDNFKGTNSENNTNSVNTSQIIEGSNALDSNEAHVSGISDHDDDHHSLASKISGMSSIQNATNQSHLSDSHVQSDLHSIADGSSHKSEGMDNQDFSMTHSPNQSTPAVASVHTESALSADVHNESIHSGALDSESHHTEAFDNGSHTSEMQSHMDDLNSHMSHVEQSELNQSTFAEMESVKTKVNEFDSEHQDAHSTSMGSTMEITQSENVSQHSMVHETSNDNAVISPKNSEVSDLDSIDDSLEEKSSNVDALSSQLDKLDQMSNLGEMHSENNEDTLDEHHDSHASVSHHESMSQFSLPNENEVQTFSQSQHSIEHSSVHTTEHLSGHSHDEVSSHPTQSYHSEPQDSHQMSTHSVHVEESHSIHHEPSAHSADVSELKFTKQEKPTPIMQDNDVDTVITDENDKPLTEGDKKIILDELEGKSDDKLDMTINHKRIESLHHINVYHYLPPKFINADASGFAYPGMMMPQQQQMTPGPIINIHNSTTSSGGNGGGDNNNMYDVGPDGKLHSMGGGVVAQPTPTQNWGQVVYNNSHHGVHAGILLRYYFNKNI
jgi:hypothetical protein